jgi:protein-S-isoprenylcysteine O-methyltransferase Ste14
MTAVPVRLVLPLSCLFFLAGPGLEAGVGPYVVAQVADGGDLPGGIAVRLLGGVLIAAGLAVVIDAFVRFVAQGRGTPSPMAPPERLVVTGAYRHVRHPMYVATAAMIAGEGLAFHVPVLLACAAVYLAAMAVLSGTREEPRLAARYGADWEAYRAAVPGWWPRWRVRPRSG